jgi:putative inorganic carbon (HCO3(-)) transporter
VRDVVVVAIILGAVPICFFRPYIGILLWVWVAYFNPHRYCYGFAYNFPVAITVAVPTLLGILFSRDLNRRWLNWQSGMLLCFWAWTFFTYFNALHIPFFQDHMLDAKAELVRLSKILLMTFMMILVVTTKEKLRIVTLLTALCFSFLAIKGTIFGALTGGQYRVWGPPDSFLEDNNSVGLAMNMAIPMMFYLARDEQNRWIRWALYGAVPCAILTVLLTYSRGGMLGLAAVLCAMALKSKYKFLGAFAVVTCALLVLTFAPAKWTDRMSTLKHEGVDSSAQQRLVSWGTTWNFVQDYPIAGGGFETLPDPRVFQRYQSRPMPGGYISSGPHSIYFQVLGDHGFVGLAIYLALLLSCLLGAWRLRRRTRGLPEMDWVEPYSNIVEASLVGFMVSGAFLGLADFDLYFQVVAFVVLLKIIHRKEMMEAVHRLEESPREIVPEPLHVMAR